MNPAEEDLERFYLRLEILQIPLYIVTLVIPYWLLKCTVAIFGTPFVYLGVRWLGPREPRG